MIVKAQCTGHAVTALHVGRENARRYFARSSSIVELQLDHLSIECRLPSEFWRDRPEIRDRRLCAWLESKQHDRPSSQAPFTLAMIPAGQNCYRLAKVQSRSATRFPLPLSNDFLGLATSPAIACPTQQIRTILIYKEGQRKKGRKLEGAT